MAQNNQSNDKVKKDLQNLNVLESTFVSMNNEAGRLGMNLLKEAKFLKTTLTKLKAEVKKTGVVTDMCQGSYSIQRENPALKSYNASLKSYQSLLKQMSDLIVIVPKSPEDEFDDFNK